MNEIYVAIPVAPLLESIKKEKKYLKHLGLFSLVSVIILSLTIL